MKNWETIFLVEAKKKCIHLSWIFARLPSLGHILLSKPLMITSWGWLDIFSPTYTVLRFLSKTLQYYNLIRRLDSFGLPNSCSSWEELDSLTLEVTWGWFCFKKPLPHKAWRQILPCFQVSLSMSTDHFIVYTLYARDKWLPCMETPPCMDSITLMFQMKYRILSASPFLNHSS